MIKASLLLFLCLLSLPLAHAEGEEDDGPVGAEATRTKAARLMALTGDADFADERTGWDRTYSRRDYVFGKDPSDFLVAHVGELPKGPALDLAAGEGRNAVYLAKKGFRVEGVDISAVGLRKAKKLAAENGVKIQTVNADLNKYRIKPDHYSVILIFNYVQRSLVPQIRAGLRKGGVVVFEANTVDQLKLPNGRSFDREFLLEPGELKRLFGDFEVVAYRETNDGKSALASLVARKK